MSEGRKRDSRRLVEGLVKRRYSASDVAILKDAYKGVGTTSIQSIDTPANRTWELSWPGESTPSRTFSYDRDPNSRVGTLASGGIIGASIANLAAPRYPLLKISELSLSNPWHFACISLKATVATDLGYHFGKAPGSGPRVSLSDMRSVERFLNTVYEKNGMDLSDILLAMSIDYFASGNGYLELESSIGEQSITCIYAVPAPEILCHRTLPIFIQTFPDILAPGNLNSWAKRRSLPEDEKDKFPCFATFPRFCSGIKRDEYKDLLPPHQISSVVNTMVNMRNYFPSLDPYYGVSDACAAMASIYGDIAATDYNIQFFRNNAVPRYVVKVTGGRVTPEVRDMIVDFLNTDIKGDSHRTIVIPLPRGMEAEFQPIDTEVKDASFIAYKKMNREEIAAVHRVPPSEIGIMDSAIKANVTQAAKNFFQKVIRPYQARVERLMNRILTLGLGTRTVQFAFNNVEYTDDQERANVEKARAEAFNTRISAITSAIALLESQVTSGRLEEGDAKEKILTLLESIGSPDLDDLN